MAQMPTPTTTAPIVNADVPPRFLHVYATQDGESHIRELTVSQDAGPAPVISLEARTYSPSKVDWHLAPAPQFVINLTGSLEVELSDGTRRHIGPGDLVFLDDVHGKGHVTRLLGPVTCLFMRTAEGFDPGAWASGKGG